MKKFLKNWWSTIVVFLFMAGVCIWAATWPSSKRYREYLKWEYFSSDTTLVLSKYHGD
jgi:hypothetical protein